MIPREVSDYLKIISTQYPVVTVTGPRQSGKTILVKYIFKEKVYINFENPEEREYARMDPKGFFKRIPDGAILDEIQRVPELTSYIQVIVDEKKQNGMFIITGSQQFEVINTINQSLAGRTALIKLLPLSLSELGFYKYKGINEVLYQGFYPRIFDQHLDPTKSYSDYFETYVERDLRQLMNIKNLNQFEKFVKICASRIGQLLNLVSLGNDVGISHTTGREWLNLLQASYIVFLLEPYYRNIGKHLIKTPKIYFFDTGLLCYLLGIENENHLEHHPLRGNIFENLVIAELIKYRFNQGKSNNLNFFRDQTGNEIDVIYNLADKLILIEIKSSETVIENFFKGFKAIDKFLSPSIKNKILVYNGEREGDWNDVQLSNVFNLPEVIKKIEASIFFSLFILLLL